MMPRMTKKTRMFTLLPTLSAMTANMVMNDSMMSPPVKRRAPEKMPMMSDTSARTMVMRGGIIDHAVWTIKIPTFCNDVND